MTRSILIVLLLATPALAQTPPSTASPWGSSPFVVDYTPPAVVTYMPPPPPPASARAHSGFTLEAALGGATTSRDSNTVAFTLALGGWMDRDVALSLRFSGMGSYGFAGASLQYYVAHSLWLGAGVGDMRVTRYDERSDGIGGFARVGYQLTQSGVNAVYLSGEVQGASIDGETHAIALAAIGYQLL